MQLTSKDEEVYLYDTTTAYALAAVCIATNSVVLLLLQTLLFCLLCTWIC